MQDDDLGQEDQTGKKHKTDDRVRITITDTLRFNFFVNTMLRTYSHPLQLLQDSVLGMTNSSSLIKPVNVPRR